MKKSTFNSMIWVLVIAPILLSSTEPLREPLPSGNEDAGEYTLIVEGYDWGPAASRVVLSLKETLSSASSSEYEVSVRRSTEQGQIPEEMASGQRSVQYAYVSDKNGNRVSEGKFLTLLLAIGPDMVLASPMQYIPSARGNVWINYQLNITHTKTGQVWNKEANRILPLVNEFDLTGKYTHNGGINLTYASFTPKATNKKSPLIIWLHGGGEGGTDTTVPLMANRAANYASEEIQSLFGGAYVLVPQSPTFWMQSASGEYTRGKENDIYNEALMGLIKKYVADHPQIDTDRIYVGGCSNGGYMSLKLILLYPDYFAAGYISALAYHSQFITDEQLQKIKDVPIWFLHSKDDPVTLPDETVVPLYKRLMEANAQNVHFSYYDNVKDITGFFGGPNYRYHGHFSWIYSHANHADFDFQGNPVLWEGKPVTIMEWMAAQRN
ncbi:alpha/beta hydrolase-fold protein [Ulvibacterium sp.]|uniref:prolyl oligopeptidase family serine peptidase n=1 Tax=Ulvibacterium sp. TaxID=2665914 RepID=UPI002624DC5C|nr:alpha/beta hydrolase-fold protein [Ulvibacterium sp.]